MKTLEKNERFAEYFEELDYGQMAQLEKSLKSDLTSEPIQWWHNPERDQDEILDGHHRYDIAKRCGLELQLHEKHFKSEDEALLFIIRNQTTRRNLSDRSRVVRLAVELEIKVGGKTKTEAVKDVAADLGIAERTAWEDVKLVNPVEAFREAKAQFEKKITTVKNRAAAKLKAEIVKDGLDEDAATAQWEGIEAEIDEQFKDDAAEVEALGEAAQQAVEQSPAGAKNTGGKRGVKKSVQDRASRRNTFKKALSLISKLRNEAFYFWKQNGCGTVDITVAEHALVALADEIEAEQKADVEKVKKKKFGR